MSMKIRVWKHVPAVVLSLSILAGCGQGKMAAIEPQQAIALEDIRSAIVSSGGYSSNAIELLTSPVHLRVSISDDKLAHANQVDRESAATTIATTVEQAIPRHASLSGLQVISVAIVHPAPADVTGSDHIEDVIEFRKGPSQRFSRHIT